jgi:hypothetical protein
VRDIVERAGARPNRLLLVGGFGSSAYLRRRLLRDFAGSMGELLTPPFAYSAVVEGAVRYLQRPTTIAARVSTLTYGVQVRPGWAAAAAASCAERFTQCSAHTGWRLGRARLEAGGKLLTVDRCSSCLMPTICLVLPLVLQGAVPIRPPHHAYACRRAHCSLYARLLPPEAAAS